LKSAEGYACFQKKLHWAFEVHCMFHVHVLPLMARFSDFPAEAENHGVRGQQQPGIQQQEQSNHHHEGECHREEAKEDCDLASPSSASDEKVTTGDQYKVPLVNHCSNWFLVEAVTDPFILNNRQPSKVTDII
jgi:hypothetical protein